MGAVEEERWVQRRGSDRWRADGCGGGGVKGSKGQRVGVCMEEETGVLSPTTALVDDDGTEPAALLMPSSNNAFSFFVTLSLQAMPVPFWSWAVTSSWCPSSSTRCRPPPRGHPTPAPTTRWQRVAAVAAAATSAPLATTPGCRRSTTSGRPHPPGAGPTCRALLWSTSEL